MWVCPTSARRRTSSAPVDMFGAAHLSRQARGPFLAVVSASQLPTTAGTFSQNDGPPLMECPWWLIRYGSVPLGLRLGEAFELVDLGVVGFEAAPRPSVARQFSRERSSTPRPTTSRQSAATAFQGCLVAGSAIGTAGGPVLLGRWRARAAHSDSRPTRGPSRSAQRLAGLVERVAAVAS